MSEDSQSNKFNTDHKPEVTEFLPTIDDNVKLRHEFKFLIGQILAKYVPELNWKLEVLPKTLYHRYQEQVKKVSESVSYTISFFFLC